jgi:ribosomal protein S18 acetylase RimI-like enzyme
MPLIHVRHYPTRDLTADWRPGDAAGLARLWNESAPGWPGGLRGAHEQTPEEAQRSLKEQDLLAAFVAEADDRIVAYCDLNAQRGDRQAHIPRLNAHPVYHGRGFGKAVLLSCVEKAIDLGFDQVHLGTWAGNLKAVPLYKKAGFMWVPETQAWMLNFVPFALRHPLARPFFERHNWYDTQVRDLALLEDAYRHGEVRAFEYVWRADGDLLRMVFDRHSWGLLEIETNELRVGCYLPGEKVIADLPQAIRWEIESKRGRDLQAVVVCRPDPGIACDFQGSFTVRGREVRSAEFVVAPDIRDKEKAPFAHIIRSAVLLDGEPVELAAGMDLRQPAAVEVERDFVSLRPRQQQQVLLRVRSNLEQPAQVRVAASSPGGARMKRQAASLQMQPHSRKQVPVLLTPEGAGQVDITARVSLRVGRRTIRAKDARVALRARGPGDLVGSADEDRAILESDSLRVILDRGGRLRVFDRMRDGEKAGPISLIRLSPPALGPPFVWQEFFTGRRLDAAIERPAGAVTAVVRCESVQRPGVLLERRITLTHRPVVEIRDAVINTTAETRDLAVLRQAWAGERQQYAGLPAPGGISEAPNEGAGLGLYHLRAGGEDADWPEGWSCVWDEHGYAVGLIWEQASRVEQQGWRVQQSLGRLRPGARAEAPALHVFVGPGGAQAVRSWWQTLHGGKADTFGAREPTASTPALEFGLEPSPTIITPEGAQVRAFARSAGRRKLSGRLRLAMPPGAHADQRIIAFDDLDQAHPVASMIGVKPASRARPGVAAARAELRLEEVTYRRELPLILLPKQPPVIEERGQDGVLALRAAPMTLRVDPAFCGCAVSLTWQGRELLHSGYPDAGPFMYWNPWFGGIWPQLGDLGGLLHHEKFRARFISRRGRSGATWRGIGVSCSPKHERGRNVRLTLEYMLLPGLPVLALGVACANRHQASARFEAGADVWLALGGKPTDAILVHRAGEPGAVRRRRPDHVSVSCAPWGIVENPAARCAVLLTSGSPHAARAGVDLTGRDGYHLVARSWGTLEPGQRSRSVLYLACGATARQVQPWCCLSGCGDLP